MPPTQQQFDMWEKGSTMTNSDFVAAKMDDRPFVSPKTFKSLSVERQEQLLKDIDAGMFRGGPNRSASSGVPVVGSGMMKQAQAQSGSYGGGGYMGNGNTTQVGPQIYSPPLLDQNLSMPRNRQMATSWCRIQYQTNPIVQSAISLHSSYPISRLNIRCYDKEVEEYFEGMNEDLDLLQTIMDISTSYWLVGEAFPYLDWSDTNGCWDRAFLQNPDYVIVKKTMGDPEILIQPDDQLKNIANSNKSADVAQRKMLPRYIIDAVRKGDNIPVPSENISHIARKLDSTQIRGTGLPTTIFRQLMLMDTIRESEYTQYQDMINPLTIIKVGSGDFKPTPDALEAYRQVFEQAVYNRNFKIFTHEGVDVSIINRGSGIYDTSVKYTQLMNEVYAGLLLPKNLIDSDITYANASVNLDVLKQRYMHFRMILTKWLQRKVFRRVSEVQGFYKYGAGNARGLREKKLIIPDVEFNKMSLFETNDYITQIVQLTQKDAKRVSLHTLYTSLGLDYDNETQKMRRERIQDEIDAKEVAALKAMSLSELRELKTDDVISEKVGAPDAGAEGAPGGDMGAPALPGVGGGPSELGGGPPMPPSPSSPPPPPP